MSLIFLLNQLGENRIKLLLNEPMRNHTTFKIGGIANVVICPSDTGELVTALKLCKENSLSSFVMGNGSNLLFDDNGTQKVIIKTKDCNKITVKGDTIVAQCGVMLPKLASVACENSLTGLEFAAGIPASVGGAVFMNAGAYEGEMSQLVEKTTYCDKNGNIFTLSKNEHNFSYRHSFFEENKDFCVLETELKLKEGNKAQIEQKMQELNTRRREKQPLDLPSAGSAFKRPEGDYAAALIDQCGLKGFKVGGAKVSEKHSGFIVNIGNATCSDVLELMKCIKQKVYNQKGIELTPEIIYVK